MFNILVIEDSMSKLGCTKEYLTDILGECNFTNEVYAKGGVNEALENKYDLIVVDMYMPINSDGRIDREGGFYVLDYLKRSHRRGDSPNKDTLMIVNSSEPKVREQMNDKGYEDLAFVLHDISCDMTSEWTKALDPIYSEGVKKIEAQE